VTALLLVLLVVVVVAGTAVVLEGDPLHQVMILGLFGQVLSVLFVVLQAPDVALSQLVVGTLVLPTMVLVALARLRRTPRRPPAASRTARPMRPPSFTAVWW
jgi:energy-converting hydrogenase B subunit D